MNLIFRKFSIYYNTILSRYKYSTIKLQSSKTRQTFKIFSIIEKMHKKKKERKKGKLRTKTFYLTTSPSPHSGQNSNLRRTVSQFGLANETKFR